MGNFMYILNLKTSYLKDLDNFDNKTYNKLTKKLKIVLPMMIEGKWFELSLMPYRSHKLKGKYNNYFDLHLAGDIVLIYSINESENIIDLVRIGTHNQVFT